jgi:hypothetical protein
MTRSEALQKFAGQQHRVHGRWRPTADQVIDGLINLGLLKLDDAPFRPCPGCDGHECDWAKGVCAYPPGGQRDAR